MELNKRLLQPIRYKAIDSNFKVKEESSRTVSFYAAYFGNVDSDNEMIIKGAFSKSLQEHGVNSASPQKIAYLYQHRMDKPIGKLTKIVEDEKGLYCEAVLDDIQLANDVMKQYASGTLNQHSIGFRYIWDKVEWDEENQVIILKEVNLKEVSVVTIGANENTPFVGFKSEQLENEIVSHSKELEKELKDLDPEKADILRQLISKSVALAEAKEPIKITPEPTEPLFDIEKAIKLLNENN